MSESGLRERALEELRLYVGLSLYLYVCFAALMLYQDSVLQSVGHGLLPHGIAVIKALVLGKFLLIGRALGAGTRIPVSTVAGRIVLRTALLVLVLALLVLLEELLVGRLHGRAFATTVAELAGNPGLEHAAKGLVMTLILLPLVALEETGRALGPGVLRRALFARRDRSVGGAPPA